MVMLLLPLLLLLSLLLLRDPHIQRIPHPVVPAVSPGIFYCTLRVDGHWISRMRC